MKHICNTCEWHKGPCCECLGRSNFSMWGVELELKVRPNLHSCPICAEIHQPREFI